MLLQMFAAVVVGGTMLGGGRGGPLGTIFGAYILMMVVNILLELNVSAYYSTVAEGAILILAVLTGSFSRNSPLAYHTRRALLRWRARRNGLLPSQRSPDVRMLALSSPAERPIPALAPTFLIRHAETLRFAAPAYIFFVLVVLVTQAALGHAIGSWSYYNSLIVLTSFLAVLALGQGSVILTGGLDAFFCHGTIGLCGILLAGMVKGSDAALIYSLPMVLVVGAIIGFINGAGVALLGISPVVMDSRAERHLAGSGLWSIPTGRPTGFRRPFCVAS